MRRCSRSNAAVIFAECHVAHIKNRVFDAPVGSNQTQQIVGVCLIPAQRRDSVHGFNFSLALARAATREFERLRYKRPFQK